MKTSAPLCLALVLAATLAVVPAQAPHSFAAQYDRNAEVALEGTITRFEWANPHAHIYLEWRGQMALSPIGTWNWQAPTC